MTLEFYLGPKKVKKVEIPVLEDKKRLDFYISESRVMPVVLDYNTFNIIKGYVLGVLGKYFPLEGEEKETFLEENPKFKHLEEGLVKKENYTRRDNNENFSLDKEVVSLYTSNFERLIKEFSKNSYAHSLKVSLNGRRFFKMTGAFLYLSRTNFVIDEVTYRQGLLETIILSDLATKRIERKELKEDFKSLILKLYGVKITE